MRIAVYCGARDARGPAWNEATREVGRLIGERGHSLVYGGGNVGLMGVVADAALEAGAHVTGVIPHSMVEKELAHTGIQDQRRVTTMDERKVMMTAESDAAIALPGGFGTLDEIFEAITLLQLEQIDCPIGFLNTEGFYDHLWAFLKHAEDLKFVPTSTMEKLTIEREPAALLNAIGC